MMLAQSELTAGAGWWRSSVSTSRQAAAPVATLPLSPTWLLRRNERESSDQLMVLTFRFLFYIEFRKVKKAKLNTGGKIPENGRITSHDFIVRESDYIASERCER